jgi:hypothetical protein
LRLPYTFILSIRNVIVRMSEGLPKPCARQLVGGASQPAFAYSYAFSPRRRPDHSWAQVRPEVWPELYTADALTNPQREAVQPRPAELPSFMSPRPSRAIHLATGRTDPFYELPARPPSRPPSSSGRCMRRGGSGDGGSDAVDQSVCALTGATAEDIWGITLHEYFARAPRPQTASQGGCGRQSRGSSRRPSTASALSLSERPEGWWEGLPFGTRRSGAVEARPESRGRRGAVERSNRLWQLQRRQAGLRSSVQLTPLQPLSGRSHRR